MTKGAAGDRGDRTATIFALASAPGRAGIAVFRLSGPLAGPALAALTRAAPGVPRRAVRARFHDTGGDLIDDGLALWFPAPASFTGEDLAELHLHGGRAVAEATAEALIRLGLRPAEPGEFSRRAVLAGKLDLTRAEAIADLVDADTGAQRRQALRQMGGALAGAVEAWRDRLIRARALIEAEIDFSDQDLPAGVGANARSALAALAADMAAALADARRGERLREGFQVVLLGAPNVGKSSLLNRLAGRAAAIVTDRPGTTRDVVEVHFDLGGYPVTLADTAGLRAAADEAKSEGIRRSLARAESADLRLVVFDASAATGPDGDSLALLDGAAVAVFNKIDLAVLPNWTMPGPTVMVSATTGAGIDALVDLLARRAADALEAGSGPALNRPRHRAAVGEAAAALRRALSAPLPELAAEDVRVASDALGRITGRVGLEEVLDRIFGEFCIGK